MIKAKKRAMIKAKKRAMIKGDMRMMGIKENHHHIQECVKMFKKITSSITYLMISKKG
jgi:alanine-alpha-ketoisovalerate/valine-pyruvate aminotransferase